MANGMRILIVLSFVLVVLVPCVSGAREVPPAQPVIAPSARHNPEIAGTRSLRRTAAANTTVIYQESFDSGGGCTAAGWTAVDLTTEGGPYFHVDDYAGLASITPLQGSQSMWCGARPAAGPPLCQYATLPGYGNGWEQFLETRDCIPVSGDLDASFLLRIDTEPSYDAAWLEYTADCSGETGWTEIDGGLGYWDNDNFFNVSTSYPVNGATDVRVRFRFRSDGAFSDEDGMWDTNGAIHLDDLVVEGLPLENFEDETAGATSSDDWVATVTPGYGIFAGLVPGSAQVQEDPCANDLSCVWAFFVGSTFDYSCGGYPAQPAVPFKNSRNQYIHNEVWSPDIPLAGSGGKLILEFTVYRDLPGENQIFYLWAVRSGDTPCSGPWKSKNLRYFGDKKDWYVHREDVSHLVNLAANDHVNIALAVRDFCPFACSIYAPGTCHSHAPLFDNVRLLRVDVPHAPLWDIRDVRQFTDRFPTNGTITGTVPADAADGNDYARVDVQDAFVGLATDSLFGGQAVYTYVSVWPQGQPGKSGAALSENAATWPVVGTWVDAGGTPWTKIRMSPSVAGYTIGLRDDLFTPGDTVCFFYAARNNSGVENYAFGSDLSLTTFDREEAAAGPAEFTCLPAGGYNRGGDVLYVDAAGGHGAQPLWDTAFAMMGIADQVDRIDVRAPLSCPYWDGLSTISSISQLTACYRKIVFDTGEEVGCGNVDYSLGLLAYFLDELTEPGGVLLCGDDLPSLMSDFGSGALQLHTNYIPYNLVSDDARPAHGVSPAGIPTPGSIFSDSFAILGACPGLNDFDVMEPAGGSVVQISYGAFAGSNGAVLSRATTNPHNTDVGVVLSGFGFANIADDDTDGVSDRAQHLHDIITWLGNLVNPPTEAGPRAHRTGLDQNYPNPFNPQTTIGFSLRERGLVRLVVYDVAGARVRTIADEEFAAGAHTRVWDGRNDAGQAVASGVYFYELVAGDFRQTRKMVLLK